MNFASWLLWGFVGTAVLSVVVAAAQGLGLTRMNLPYLLGTILTPDRDRAKVVGTALHFANGWLFALVYFAVFHALGAAAWWLGALTGLGHASFLLTVGLPLLPALHPRMANEQYGPTVVRHLEPPGFLGLNYGRGTPISVLVAHVAFGAVLGAFCDLDLR
jgi:hypothetical protein